MRRDRLLLLLVVLAILLLGGYLVLRKLSDAEEARLSTVRPEVRNAFGRLRAFMAAEGIELFVVSGGRTAAEQMAKVTAGLSGTGAQSWHLLGRAIDFNVGIRDPATGKLRADNKAEDVAAYRKVHAAAGVFGFRGIPNGSPFKPDGTRAYITNAAGNPLWDVFHLEYTGGMTFAEAKARDGRAVT